MNDKITSGILTPNLRHWTNRQVRRFTRLKALAILGVSLCALALPDQAVADEPRARATITFENGDSITIRSGRKQFRPIEILPAETVQIHLQLPPGLANMLVATQALDGGLTSGDVVIASDGTAAIAFQAGIQPGLYRLLLSARGSVSIWLELFPDVEYAHTWMAAFPQLDDRGYYRRNGPDANLHRQFPGWAKGGV